MNTYTETKEYFERTDSGKSWKSKPYKVETKKIDQVEYENTTDENTQKFFRRFGGSETATRSYTMRGYIITRLVSCNPSRDEKHVRTFSPIK